MNFKEQIKNDVDVFLNFNEFAEPRIIDGREINVIIDEDVLKTKSRNKSEQYDGVYLEEILIYVKAVDFDECPVYGQRMKVDRKFYYVNNCTESAGMLEITLGANES
ncbi:hypothetical protein [Schinkia azotoformans]|uniref:hypothetical protein n=1 Tax=Schinkia azotoformans TaxID=1454 RepID=UPI002DBA682C|nr:hypothetical protein [Schinkia azotoformans]MEC1744124.1 hypothetical protein [Schinkia azotoformans]